jgi:hypothetical protein
MMDSQLAFRSTRKQSGVCADFAVDAGVSEFAFWLGAAAGWRASAPLRLLARKPMAMPLVAPILVAAREPVRYIGQQKRNADRAHRREEESADHRSQY